MWFYNICVAIYTLLIRLAAPFNRKARLWSEGRKGLTERLQQAIVKDEHIVWVHSSSLGEFEQGRPLVEMRKNYPNADYVFYFPADTRREVRKFLDVVNPEVAIFVKNEFWLNMLAELRAQHTHIFGIGNFPSQFDILQPLWWHLAQGVALVRCALCTG